MIQEADYTTKMPSLLLYYLKNVPLEYLAPSGIFAKYLRTFKDFEARILRFTFFIFCGKFKKCW